VHTPLNSSSLIDNRNNIWRQYKQRISSSHNFPPPVISVTYTRMSYSAPQFTQSYLPSVRQLKTQGKNMYLNVTESTDLTTAVIKTRQTAFLMHE
jgi:protoporphyrinogen oxidase